MPMFKKLIPLCSFAISNHHRMQIFLPSRFRCEHHLVHRFPSSASKSHGNFADNNRVHHAERSLFTSGGRHAKKSSFHHTHNFSSAVANLRPKGNPRKKLLKKTGAARCKVVNFRLYDRTFEANMEYWWLLSELISVTNCIACVCCFQFSTREGKAEFSLSCVLPWRCKRKEMRERENALLAAHNVHHIVLIVNHTWEQAHTQREMENFQNSTFKIQREKLLRLEERQHQHQRGVQHLRWWFSMCDGSRKNFLSLENVLMKKPCVVPLHAWIQPFLYVMAKFPSRTYANTAFRLLMNLKWRRQDF